MKKIIPFLLLFALTLPGITFAIDPIEETHEVVAGHDEHEESAKGYILHHLQDSYDFTVWPKMGWVFPLPIILWDNGLHIFSSFKFDHGEAIAESKGNYYKIHHNKIYRTDAAGNLTFDKEGHPTNPKPLDFSITKNVFFVMLMSLLLLIIFGGLATSYKNNPVPRKGGKFLEPLILFVRDEIARPNIGEKHYRKYMGYLLTVFFFIWFLNLSGLTPIGINVTGNIAVTLALALMTFIITQFTANKNYWKHIFWMPGVPVFMKIALMPIELLGLIIKPFSLMIRLYANISAGHIVIMSLLALLYVFTHWMARGAFLGLTLFLSVIELLVAFLQAYIFTMLTALYFGAAVAEHDDH